MRSGRDGASEVEGSQVLQCRTYRDCWPWGGLDFALSEMGTAGRLWAGGGHGLTCLRRSTVAAVGIADCKGAGVKAGRPVRTRLH